MDEEEQEVIVAFYLNGGWSKCPNPACHSKDLVGNGEYVADANYVIFPIRCEKCGWTWDDEYTLSHIGNIKTK